jgi:hypothetical protein
MKKVLIDVGKKNKIYILGMISFWAVFSCFTMKKSDKTYRIATIMSPNGVVNFSEAKDSCFYIHFKEKKSRKFIESGEFTIYSHTTQKSQTNIRHSNNFC